MPGSGVARDGGSGRMILSEIYPDDRKVANFMACRAGGVEDRDSDEIVGKHCPCCRLKGGLCLFGAASSPALQRREPVEDHLDVGDGRFLIDRLDAEEAGAILRDTEARVPVR